MKPQHSFPLSPLQQGLLFHTLQAPQSGVYLQQLIGEFHEPLDMPQFTEAWHHIFQRHAMFRTGFTWKHEGESFQTVHPWVPLPLKEYDCRKDSPSDRQQYIDQYLEQDRAQDFDLQQPPLMRLAIFHLGDTHHKLIWTSHHLLLDGRARFLILKELFAHYDARCKDIPLSFPSPPPFHDFVDWLTKHTFTNRESYWRTRLKGIQEATPLPFFEPSSSHPDIALTSHTPSITLSEKNTQNLRFFANSHGLTLNTLLQGAWAIYLGSLTGQPSVLFGVTRSGRRDTIKDADNIIGPCFTTLPLRIEITPQEQVLPWLKHIRTIWKELQEQEHTPLPLIHSWSEVPSSEPLFNSLLLFDHSSLNQALQSLGERWQHRCFSLREHPHFPFTIHGYGGNQLLIQVSYDPTRLSPEKGKRILRQLESVLMSMAEHPMQTLREVCLLPKSERTQLLVDWNETARPYPAISSLQQLIEQQVEATPDSIAMVFGDQHVTYRMLNTRGNQLAHYLRRLKIGPDNRVGVLMERSGKFLHTLLGILKSGAAYIPLDPTNPPLRNATMLQDSTPSLLLTDQTGFAHLPPDTSSIPYLDTEDLPLTSESITNPKHTGHPDHLAYVIFTSGSTGTPKGVMNTHRGIINRLSWMQETVHLDRSERVLQKTPFNFDVSVWELFGPLLGGGTVLMAKPEGHRDGRYLVELIATQQITTAHFVPSQLQDLVNIPTLPACRSLKRVICSGEPLPPSLQRDFFSVSESELHNLYGPTEAAIDVTAWVCHRNETPSTIPIGYPIANTRTFVLTPWFTLSPIGIPGQLLLEGPQLARGYWNRPALTAEAFIPHPFSPTPGNRLYTTGDLVRYDHKGALEFLGRIDHQIQLRGHRIELGEIESVLRKNPLVQNAIVLCRKTDTGESQLLAYIIPATRSTCSIDILRKALIEELPRYMVPTHFFLMPSFPLTNSGKIDRNQLLKHNFQEHPQEGPYTSPDTLLQKAIAEIWETVLGRATIGIHQNFFDIGGHSLLATQVMSRIGAYLQKDLPLGLIFKSPTIAHLASTLTTLTETGTFPTISNPFPRERPPTLSPSYAQQRLWFLQKFQQEETAYHMSVTLEIHGQLEERLLRESFQKLIDRHESLRTCFPSHKGQPIQVIAPRLTAPWEKRDLRSLGQCISRTTLNELIQKEVHTPFDLTACPLFRVLLLQIKEEEHLLVITLHHIIADGWSLGVMSHDLHKIYDSLIRGTGPTLSPLPIQYADFSLWQHKWLQTKVFHKQLSFWKNHLSGVVPLVLPTDRPRPTTLTHRGKCHEFPLDPSLLSSLHLLSQNLGVTLAITLLAGFKILLAKYTGQRDITIGSPIANRNRPEIEPLIGFFVNSLVMRTDLSGTPTLEDIIRRVHTGCLGAYDNQDLPFEKLVEQLAPPRDPGRHPFFQIMFAVQNTPFKDFDFPGLTVTPFLTDVTRTRFDLECHVVERGPSLHVRLIHNQDLFNEEHIHRFARDYQRTLSVVSTHSQTPLSRYSLLDEAEQAQLLVQSNRTTPSFTPDGTLPDLFKAQVIRRPHSIAIVSGDHHITYERLHDHANQLAHFLRRQGIGLGERIGIWGQRGIQAIISMLGVVKAGAVYVPVDPHLPLGRIQHLFQDAEIQWVLTPELLTNGSALTGVKVISLEEEKLKITGEPTTDWQLSQTSAQLACIMFTSGSTGLPKGILTTHRNIIRVAHKPTFVSLEAPQRIFQLSPLAFDASTFEIWGGLLNGSTVVIYPKDLLDSEEIGAYLEHEQITTIWLTAGLFHQLVQDQIPRLSNVPQVLAGGDTLAPQYVHQLLQQDGHRIIINGYGPTENTVFTCCERLTKDDPPDGTVPIGNPISHTDVYVMDQHQELVPIGLPGELLTGGAGLALGYLNQPARTAESFIPHPFSSFPGTRLYRTGDQVRWLHSGQVEFLGRHDRQMKIRGFRVELREIEAVLNQHPQVETSLVVCQDPSSDDKHLVAYIVGKSEHGSQNGFDPQAWERWTHHLKTWEELYEETYQSADSTIDPTFNTTGWTSSYTGLPIPSEEMREWVEGTVNRIQAFQPRQVLEIGCGTGLLLHRLAPSCQVYVGTDFSLTSLTNLQSEIALRPSLQHVHLDRRPAHDFSGFKPHWYDTVILNSVIQYFPDATYLITVLEGATALVKPGGRIIVGDVRDLFLQEAFHASVQLEKAEEEIPIADLKQHIRWAQDQEEELVIAPLFFTSLVHHISRVGKVEILLKQGRAHNELTRFRYDVILHIDPPRGPETDILWMDWVNDRLNLPALQSWFQSQKSFQVGISRIPNSRLFQPNQIKHLLEESGDLETSGKIRHVLSNRQIQGIDPQDFWEAFANLPYWCELGYEENAQVGQAGMMTAMFCLRNTSSRPCVLESSLPKSSFPIPFFSYTTNPLKAQKVQTLTRELHTYLRGQLPEFMVPPSIVPLDRFSLTPNGKIDLEHLRKIQRPRPTTQKPFAAPQSATERQLADIWSTFLPVTQIGRYDNFFELGGHSLLAMRVIASTRTQMQADVSVRSLFDSPTIAQFALTLSESSTLPKTLLEPSLTSNAFSLSEFQNSLPEGLTIEYRDLRALINRGVLPPVDSVALSYLQDFYLNGTGLSKSHILQDWYGGNLSLTHILHTSMGRVGVLMLPRTGYDLYRDQGHLLDLIEEGLEISRSIGARAISLTGLLPSATAYGYAVKQSKTQESVPPPITTGHATTAATVVLNIQKILRTSQRVLSDETVGFLGLGSIGLASLELMLCCLPHPKAIILCDVYQRRRTLDTYKHKLKETYGFQGCITISLSIGSVPDSFYQSSLIVGATNVPNILDITHLQAGTLIVDDSGPHCFSPQAAINRITSRQDILFTEGGNIQCPSSITCIRYIPSDVERSMTPQLAKLFTRFHSRRITGCVLSSLLLATRPNQTPILGLVDAEEGMKNFRLLQDLGFEGADVHCEGYEAPQSQIRTFSSRFSAPYSE